MRIYFKPMVCLLALTLSGSIHIRAQSSKDLTAKEVMKLAHDNIEKYRKADITLHFVDAVGQPLNGIEIKIQQKTQDFLFGALVFDLVEGRFNADETKIFKERFSELFNFAIFPFYWEGFEPSAGHPRWDRIDPVVEWCLENGITCKGHPLGWTHEIGLPDYVLDLSLEESKTLLHSRIIENVTGFKDQITLWDVVNEPVNTVSWEMAHKDKNKESRYRSDIPIEEIADWVEHAYKTAHKANPENHYILNEFRQIADPVIRSRFYDFTEELLNRETPINGLGIQAHEPRTDWFDPVEVWETLELYSDFDLPLHITEFIPQSGGAEISGGYRTGNWTPELQAEYTEILYRIWFGHPSVVSINWWAFTDRNSWLPGGGFLTKDFQPKPVYRILTKLIKEEWMTTEIKDVTNKRGAYNFRGFHGEYEIQLKLKDGSIKKLMFPIEKGHSEVQELTFKL